MTEPDPERLLRAFADFLSNAWPVASEFFELDSRGEAQMNWLQGNWELLVESALETGVYLEPYGEGADVEYGRGTRISWPDAVPTHKVIVKPAGESNELRDLISGRIIGVDRERGVMMDEFVSKDGDWYSRKPPFDGVLVETEAASEGPFLFAMDEIIFGIAAVKRM